jgi:hypothetical protein
MLKTTNCVSSWENKLLDIQSLVTPAHNFSPLPFSYSPRGPSLAGTSVCDTAAYVLSSTLLFGCPSEFGFG